MKTNLYNNQIFTLDEILSNSKCEEIIKKAKIVILKIFNAINFI